MRSSSRSFTGTSTTRLTTSAGERLGRCLRRWRWAIGRASRVEGSGARDGVHLTERLLVARVEPGPTVPFDRWPKGHYKILPLPELLSEGGEDYSLHYELCGRVESTNLLAAERVACLDPFGICLLLQRKVHDEARVVVPTADFYDACAHVFEEAELLEDWLSAARSAGEPDLDAVAVEMHDFLRAPRDQERSLQEALLDVAKRAHVRRVVRERIKERFGTTVL
jgi:hypothetical protein